MERGEVSLGRSWRSARNDQALLRACGSWASFVGPRGRLGRLGHGSSWWAPRQCRPSRARGHCARTVGDDAVVTLHAAVAHMRCAGQDSRTLAVLRDRDTSCRLTGEKCHSYGWRHWQYLAEGTFAGLSVGAQPSVRGMKYDDPNPVDEATAAAPRDESRPVNRRCVLLLKKLCSEICACT